jgi:hypothetical protein
MENFEIGLNIWIGLVIEAVTLGLSAFTDNKWTRFIVISLGTIITFSLFLI